MKFVDEFRDPAAARKLMVAIEHLAGASQEHFKFMEVCGGHTHTIYRHGIEHLLPDNVELVHGRHNRPAWSDNSPCSATRRL